MQYVVDITASIGHDCAGFLEWWLLVALGSYVGAPICCSILAYLLGILFRRSVLAPLTAALDALIISSDYRRALVAGRYAITSDGHYGDALACLIYSPARPVDPVLVLRVFDDVRPPKICVNALILPTETV
jgi:hypothetical protein